MENKEVRLIDAKVATSKFLQLRDKLNDRIDSNKGYDNSFMRAHGTSEVTCNIWELQRAFGELCELLHKSFDNAPTIDTESLRQQWHDAETDPPKEPMEYIAMIKGGANATTLLYDGGLWFEEDEEGWQTYYKVTHWMPFPKPPKKGD